MSNVVLVVDMLKGFLEPGHNLYHADSRRIIPNALQLVEQEKAAGRKSCSWPTTTTRTIWSSRSSRSTAS